MNNNKPILHISIYCQYGLQIKKVLRKVLSDFTINRLYEKNLNTKTENLLLVIIYSIKNRR
ncbi:hypothetical protein [Anaerocolumna sp.]|uniref:hypothetical protein n=1 Tax=Anaerocolumna sp. TaxID=2041569 RepID=UPI0028B01EF1|nr:hypothetical protein [Anaerocolumna sp.]